MPDKNPLELLDDLMREDLEHLCSEVGTREFHEALAKVVVYLTPPADLPRSRQIAMSCVQLAAYSTIFRAQFANYMGFMKGTKDAAAKKNAYKELYQGIDKLVDALKYLAKE